MNDLWKDAYICPINVMKCATKSASYVMELRLWDECLWDNGNIQEVHCLMIRRLSGAHPRSCILGSATRILDWRIFMDTTTSMLYTKPTSKSQTNNSYDYEAFIIVIILNNVSVCRSKTWYMVTDMISKFSAGSAGDSILMNNSMHENFNLNYS